MIQRHRILCSTPAIVNQTTSRASTMIMTQRRLSSHSWPLTRVSSAHAATPRSAKTTATAMLRALDTIAVRQILITMLTAILCVAMSTRARLIRITTLTATNCPGLSAQPLERFAFYEEAKKCFGIVQCVGERRPYGNVIITKGVIGPDGRDLKP